MESTSAKKGVFEGFVQKLEYLQYTIKRVVAINSCFTEVRRFCYSGSLPYL